MAATSAVVDIEDDDNEDDNDRNECVDVAD